jgi:hypothetical protein
MYIPQYLFSHYNLKNRVVKLNWINYESLIDVILVSAEGYSVDCYVELPGYRVDRHNVFR